MDAALEMAKILKQRENEEYDFPVSGIVAEIDDTDIKIALNEKVVLNRDMICSIFNLFEKNADGDFIWLGRRIYLLPFFVSGRKAIYKYLALGGDAI